MQHVGNRTFLEYVTCPNLYTARFQLENKLNTIASENDRFDKEILLLQLFISPKRRAYILCFFFVYTRLFHIDNLAKKNWEAIDIGLRTE